MPKHTRGKIKEHLEGIHRNTEAVKTHIANCVNLIGDTHPEWVTAFQALQEVNKMLDENAQALHGLI